MNPPLDAAVDDRIEIAKIFAKQFNHFEWEYLCSYQWFLTAVGQALETGNFAQLTARADKTLTDDKIRLHRANTDSTHFASWPG
jgi:hypothetical protein